MFLKYVSDAGIEGKDTRHGGTSGTIWTNERLLVIYFSFIFEIIPFRV